MAWTKDTPVTTPSWTKNTEVSTPSWTKNAEVTVINGCEKFALLFEMWTNIGRRRQILLKLRGFRYQNN